MDMGFLIYFYFEGIYLQTLENLMFLVQQNGFSGPKRVNQNLRDGKFKQPRKN